MVRRGGYSRRKNSHLLKALLVSEELQVLVELKTVLLKEAIEGRLHVSELSVKPKTDRQTNPVCTLYKMYFRILLHVQPLL